ncbi:MAG: hypothetical protein AAFY02_09340 [Pseudomonadota bacterium]
MVRHLFGLALALLLFAAIWFGYQELGQLGGTWFWPYRFLVLGIAGFVLLTLAQRLWQRLPGGKAETQES